MIAETSEDRKLGQAGRILRILKRNGSKGVPNYYFAQFMQILRYSARIKELRAEGYNIETRREVINGRPTGVWYYTLLEEE